MANQSDQVPTWISVILWTMLAIMLLGLFPAIHTFVGSSSQDHGYTKPLAEIIYQSSMYTMAIKQIAIIAVVGYSLVKRNAAYIFITSLLLFVLYGLSSMYLVTLGASLNLVLSLILCIGSGVCLFTLRKRNPVPN